MTCPRAWAAVAALAVAATVAACGSRSATGAQPSSAAPSALPSSVRPSPAPGHGQPVSTVVHLSAGFSPSTVRLRTGQQFLLTVSKDVQATGLSGAGQCPPGTVRPVAGGLLTAECMTGDRYLYTANRAGAATVSATVKPQCPPGTACPQWVTEPSLKVIIG